jgi:hypothetical protein
MSDSIFKNLGAVVRRLSGFCYQVAGAATIDNRLREERDAAHRPDGQRGITALTKDAAVA